MSWASSSARRRAPVIGIIVAGLLASSAVLALSQAEKAAAASVNSISPTSGSDMGGDTLTISGSGFQTTLPVGYVAVPYIQFYKDTSYSIYAFIDTGVQLNASTQVTATYMVTTSGQQNVWGAKNGSEISLVSGDGNDEPVAYQSYGPLGAQVATQFANITPSSGILKVTAGAGSVSATLVSGGGAPGSAKTFTPVGNSANIMVGGRQMGYFTGRIYGFSIANGSDVSFAGVPAYSTSTNQYGLYDTVSNKFFANSKNDNDLIQGQIWGPSGAGGTAPQATPPVVEVAFAGKNSQGADIGGGACSNLTVLSDTTATCTVPPANLGGDDSVKATVTVKVTDALGATTKTFDYTYESDRPTLDNVAPVNGPMTGGPVALTGKKFVTLLDSLQFGGAMIDPPPGTRPAAWTVDDATVYGFVDPSTGALTPATEGDGVVSYLGGQVFPVVATTVKFGQIAATSVTVTSLTTMTVNAPPQDPDTVAVTINKNGYVASLANAYTYVAVGTLELTMEGWACPANATPGDVQTPGVCQLIPNGGYTVPGTTVTWLYTVTYVSTRPDGTPLDPSLGQLTDVSVTDTTLGVVCTAQTLPLNTPYPCIAKGPNSPP